MKQTLCTKKNRSKGKDKAVPLQARRDPEVSRKLGFPYFVTTAQDGGRLSALRTGRLYPRKYSWYSFLLEAESTPGPYCDRKDFMSMKNPLAPAGIEPATFRFVSRHFNHCATAVPQKTEVLLLNKEGRQLFFYVYIAHCSVRLQIQWTG